MAADGVPLRFGPRLGQRHVLVICLHFGLAILYVQRVSFSVALVAMVNNTAAAEQAQATPGRDTPHHVELSLTGFTHSFPWTRHLQGLLLSAFYWGFLLLQVPAGTLAQRHGAKWLLGAGIGATSLLSLCIPFVAGLSPYFLTGVLVAQGVGASISMPACVAMLGRWAPPDESSSLMSWALSGGYLGVVVGQAAAGRLCASTFLGGWPSVFYVSGVAGLLWLLPWALLTSNSPGQHPHISEKERVYLEAVIGSGQDCANKHGLPWRKLLFSRPLVVYYLLSILCSWISFTLMACLPQFLAEVLDYGIAMDGLMASLPFVGVFISSNLATLASDRLAARPCPGKTAVRKLFTFVSLWANGLCFLAMIHASAARPEMASSGLLTVAMLVLGYSLFGGLYGGYYSIPLDVCPEYAGTVFGLRNVFTVAAGIGTPVVADFLTPDGTQAEWAEVFYINVSLAFLGGLMFAVFGSSERQRWGAADDGVAADVAAEGRSGDEEAGRLIAGGGAGAGQTDYGTAVIVR